MSVSGCGPHNDALIARLVDDDGRIKSMEMLFPSGNEWVGSVTRPKGEASDFHLELVDIHSSLMPPHNRQEFDDRVRSQWAVLALALADDPDDDTRSKGGRTAEECRGEAEDADGSGD